jgi:hypothetical protein
MALKNMKDVKRKKEQLEFQSKFYKKELTISATGIFSILRIISGRWHSILVTVW